MAFEYRDIVIEESGLSLLCTVEFELIPGEREIRPNPRNETGYPGSPPEFIVNSVEVKDIDTITGRSIPHRGNESLYEFYSRVAHDHVVANEQKYYEKFAEDYYE